MFEVKKFACNWDLNSLKAMCDQYMTENFVEVASSEEFLAADVHEIQSFISRNDLRAPQEENVKNISPIV